MKPTDSLAILVDNELDNVFLILRGSPWDALLGAEFSFLDTGALLSYQGSLNSLKRLGSESGCVRLSSTRGTSWSLLGERLDWDRVWDGKGHYLLVGLLRGVLKGDQDAVEGVDVGRVEASVVVPVVCTMLVRRNKVGGKGRESSQRSFVGHIPANFPLLG